MWINRATWRKALQSSNFSGLFLKVLWRKNSFGSQSEAGSLFVFRILTVATSLRVQNRSVLEY